MSRRVAVSLVLRIAAAFALLWLASSCTGARLPNRSSPDCSWATHVPGDTTTICRGVYRTLSDIATAEVKGDWRALAALVPNEPVRRRIEAHLRRLQGNGVRSLRVVPSMTLAQVTPTRVGAGFYLLGTSRYGAIKSSNTVYLNLIGKRPVVIGDQPGQDW